MTSVIIKTKILQACEYTRAESIQHIRTLMNLPDNLNVSHMTTIFRQATFNVTDKIIAIDFAGSRAAKEYAFGIFQEQFITKASKLIHSELVGIFSKIFRIPLQKAG